MYKALKVRIYPNESQKILMDKTFGCCRVVYNYLLEEHINFYEKKIKKGKATWKDYVRTTEKKLKNKRNYKFLQEVSSVALQQSRMDLDVAFKNFFDNIKGNNNSNANYPKFKSKKDKQSYREVMRIGFNKDNKTIQLPKVGLVKFRHSDKFPKWFNNIIELRNITISKSKTNKYYCSVIFDVDNNYKPKFNRSNRKLEIALDFDLDDLYISSENKSAKKYGFKKFKQLNSKELNKLKKNFSRKSYDTENRKWSNNGEKARIKFAKLEEHIANCRIDFIEKETLRLVKSYKNIYLEDLSIKDMIQETHNAKNYLDTSWSTFIGKLQSKAKDYDCNIIFIDKYFPSSKLCSKCGYKNIELKLYQKSWKCPNCKTKWDRDYNASLNILKEGKRLRLGK